MRKIGLQILATSFCLFLFWEKKTKTLRFWRRYSSWKHGTSASLQLLPSRFGLHPELNRRLHHCFSSFLILRSGNEECHVIFHFFSHLLLLSSSLFKSQSVKLKFHTNLLMCGFLHSLFVHRDRWFLIKDRGLLEDGCCGCVYNAFSTCFPFLLLLLLSRGGLFTCPFFLF